MKDRDILSWAARESRTILTFDKDFGELALNATLPMTCGVVLFCMPLPPPAKAAIRFVAEIEARGDWAGNFSVIEPGRVRMRKLKGT